MSDTTVAPLSADEIALLRHPEDRTWGDGVVQRLLATLDEAYDEMDRMGREYAATLAGRDMEFEALIEKLDAATARGERLAEALRAAEQLIAFKHVRPKHPGDNQEFDRVLAIVRSALLAAPASPAADAPADPTTAGRERS